MLFVEAAARYRQSVREGESGEGRAYERAVHEEVVREAIVGGQ